MHAAGTQIVKGGGILILGSRWMGLLRVQWLASRLLIRTHESPAGEPNCNQSRDSHHCLFLAHGYYSWQVVQKKR